MMALQQTNTGLSLQHLLGGLVDVQVTEDVAITGLSLDSRLVQPGFLFFACRGFYNCGLDYLEDAIAAGASAVLTDKKADQQPSSDIPVIYIPELRHKVGEIAARFYANPSKAMDVIGVTGTNGKTSVAYFIAQALTADDKYDTGLIGTLGYGPINALSPALNTTPEAVTLQRTLAGFADLGIDKVAMEVSSHGLEQGRINGVDFKIAVFTNLSRDHLDYHGDMHAYGEAKKLLFTRAGLEHAVINIDDAFGSDLAAEVSRQLPVIEYALVDSFSASAPG